MYYRVKQFSETYGSMFVLDRDSNLANLKLRTTIQDCAQGGYKPFNNPTFVERQEIQCVSLGGQKRNSDIIKE